MQKGFTRFKNLIKNVTEQEFKNFYFNNSRVDTMIHFNIGNTVFSNFINYYHIKKPKNKINEIREKTCLEKYGVSNVFKDVERIKKSYINKHGSLENHYKYSIQVMKANAKQRGYWNGQSEEAKLKRKNTCLKIYNCEYYMQSQEFINKAKTTKFLKYGTSSYNNINKIKQTNLNKYGVPYNFSSTDPTINGRGTFHTRLKNDLEFKQNVVEKRGITCKKRFGEDYYIKQAALMSKRLSSRAQSTVNKAFAILLVNYGAMYEAEFQVGKYLYDFKVGNYLIEIDPYATHNSTWGIYKKPKTPDYHRNKTLNAFENGYTCVHIYDWINVEVVLYNILNNTLKIVDTGKVVKHIYDYKEKELTNKESKNTVIIYDDGFNLII